MVNKININQATNKKHYVSVVSGNGKKLVHSETYNSHAGAKNAAERLKNIIPNAVIVDKAKKK